MTKQAWVLSVMTLAVCQAVYAANDAIELDEVVVSGARTAEKLSETPMSVGVVGEKAIKRDKPKSIGEVINRIPGVSWNDLGNEQHSMGIRQPNSTNAVYQYLEDGVPIRPLGVFNHNSLNEMNLAGSESVEVVKGAASSLYGSNAVGGAVNFISARPSLTPYFSAGARSDNVTGFTREDIAASNSWGDFGVRFSQYSSRRTSDNWQKYSGGAKDSFTLRGDYLLSPTSVVHGTITHSNLYSDMTGSVNQTQYLTNPGFSSNTFTYRKDITTRANLVWEGETTNNGQTTVTLFTRQNDHGQLPSYTISGCTAGGNGTCAGTENNNHVASIGSDLKHQQDFNWLKSRLITGLYVDNSNNPYWSNNLTITQVGGRSVSYIPSVSLAKKRDYQTKILNTAVYAQYELSPLDALRLVAGVRNDAITYDFTNNLTPGANFGAPNETRSFGHVSPKIGATYAFTNQASVYTNISQGFTPPEVSQLYGTSAIPDLKPATYNNYEIGARIAFFDGALKLDSAVYRLEGTDTIVSYTPVVGASENRNAGSTRSEGVELGLNWTSEQFDARFATSVSKHTFLAYQASSTLDYSGKEMPQAPSNITNIEIGYKPLENARIALEMVQQGAYWMNNANTVSYAGHRLFNLRGNYAFAKGWEAWLQGRNLTDQLYSDSSSSSYSGTGTYTPDTQNTYTVGAPRSFMIGATFTFDGKK
jgi:outer membrane receptor protein involved in Fe transport